MSGNGLRSRSFIDRLSDALGSYNLVLLVAVCTLLPTLLTGILVLELQSFGLYPYKPVYVALWGVLLLLFLLYAYAVGNSLEERATKQQQSHSSPEIVERWADPTAVKQIMYLLPTTITDKGRVVPIPSVRLITRRHKILLVGPVWQLCLAAISLLGALVALGLHLDGTSHTFILGSGESANTETNSVPAHFTLLLVNICVFDLVVFSIRAYLRYATWASEFFAFAGGYAVLVIFPPAFLPWRTETVHNMPLQDVQFASWKRTGLARLLRSGLGKLDSPSQIDGPFHNLGPLPRADDFRRIQTEETMAALASRNTVVVTASMGGMEQHLQTANLNDTTVIRRPQAAQQRRAKRR